MKKPLIYLIILLLVSSCSDEILNEDSRQSILGETNVTFSFDSITEPSNWRKYQSLEEMLAACQIPEKKLKSMTTDELIEACMSHPLRGIYSAYNNEQDGANVIIRNFNGFAELKSRKDAAQKLVRFYEEVNFTPQIKNTPRHQFNDISHLGFMELYLASPLRI